MVFSCVIVLALLSFVTATPHEYGAKPGAVAKAEANAVAGAFGVLPVIPLSIPSGSGFSSSFSKSSASSFASSSSSASSSSYSFSGNNGIPGVGCISGTCKSGGSNIPSSFNGSPNTQIVHHNNEASSVAAAKASSESSNYFNSGNSASCQQGNCKNFGGSPNCRTGQCAGSLQISSNGEGDHGNTENKEKCLSGNCFPISKEQSDITSNPDDFEVNFARNPKITGPTGYAETTSQLNNGETSSTLYSGKNPAKCNSPTCDTFLPLSPSDDAQAFNPQKPATHLVTPNFRPLCTTHNCNTGSIVSNENNGKPSSYNVPILGSNPSLQYNIPYNPSMTPLSNFPSQTEFPVNCGSNGCTSNNAPEKTGILGSKTPKYSHLHYQASSPNSGNFVPYQITTNIPLSCNTPNCAKFPVPNQSINPGWSNTIKPNFIKTPINHIVPTYNNMFSGAIGSTTSQSNNYANHNVPSYSERFGGPKGSVNNAVYPGLTGTAKPNLVTISNNQDTPKYTNGFGGPPGPVDAAILPGSHIKPKPITSSTDSNLPLYTGGFGGPPGSVTAAGPAGIFTTLKPNLNIKPNEQIYNGGFGVPTGGLSTPTTIQHNVPVNTNIAMSLPTTPPNSFVQNSVTNPSGHANTHILQANEKEKLPPYTGGFGGPSGILKPNEYNMPSKLGSPLPATPCATLDCSKKPVSNENYNNAGTSATTSANADAVAYSGGFGAPSGLLQPEKSTTLNGYDKPTKLASPLPTMPCSTLDCSRKPVSNENYSNTGSSGTASANADAVAYVGGFSAPSGLLQPQNIENVNGNSNFKDHNKNNQVKNQENPGFIKTTEEDYTSLNNYYKQTNIKDTHSAGSQNNAGGNSDDDKEFNDFIQQANLAGAVASDGAQTNVGGASHSVNNNKYDNSDEDKMLNDYFAQVNIADAVASAGAETKGADQDNFIALTDSNSNQNSGCNNNCRSNSNEGVVAGASASAKSISNTGSWATGTSFAGGAATAHASAGASVKGGYGKR